MDGQRFDELARALTGAGGRSRRRLLGGLLGGALAALPGLRDGTAAPEAAGCRKGGKRCRHDNQCCSRRCRQDKCKGGGGKQACPKGKKRCGGTCVDTRTNAGHCGRCRNACAEGEKCAGGTCQLSGCPGGTTNCGGSCVDTRDDVGHCGACDNACPVPESNGEEACKSGRCEISCDEGFFACGVHCEAFRENCALRCVGLLSGAKCTQDPLDPDGKWHCPPGAILGGDLSGCDLRGANLIEANFDRADLYDADLSDADLTGAIVSQADLRHAHLNGTNLTRAILGQSNLLGADLGGANLTKTLWDRTICPDGTNSKDHPFDFTCCRNLNGAVPSAGCPFIRKW